MRFEPNLARSEARSQADMIDLATSQRPIVVCGGFDGLHREHRHRIAVAGEIASDAGVDLVGVVLDNCRPWLMHPSDRCTALLAAGARAAMVSRLDAQAPSAVSRTVVDLIATRLEPTLVAIGWSGSAEPHSVALQEACQAAGLPFRVITPTADRSVTTDALMRCVAQGRLDQFFEFAGGPFVIRGIVEVGDQRGRTIGFPTANLRPHPRQRLPPNGVYAGTADVDGAEYVCAVNIGLRPTFYSVSRPLVEAHLTDYSGDLYGRPLAVRLRCRLRAERKFESIDHLVTQVGEDVALAGVLSAEWRSRG